VITAQIRQLNLSIEDKKALKARYEETNNRRWQERIQGVLLKGQGLSLAAISEVVPYNINTISDWIRRDAEQGLEGICVWEYQGSHAHLTSEQQQGLKAQVTETSYRRVQDVVAWVKAEWGIEYSEDGMREMVHNLGFSYPKGCIIPGRADESGFRSRRSLLFCGCYPPQSPPCHQVSMGIERTTPTGVEQ
jgi:transposase